LELQDFGNVYYTGHHLEPEIPVGTWEPDVLDSALATISNDSKPRGIVLCHARNASRSTMGNHPFTFNYRGTTYSLMHNGNSEAARQYMISRINDLNPSMDWFSVYPSNFFADPDPRYWVDSEVLFHYIMAHLIACDGDVLQALGRALSGLKHIMDGTGGGVYNFVFCDGIWLYVFRSSPQTGSYSSYKLSYRNYKDQFYGIRTQYPSTGDVELKKQELVVFGRDAKPTHYPDICNGYLAHTDAMPTIERYDPEDHLPSPTIVSGPNPFAEAVSIRMINATDGMWEYRIYDTRGRMIWHKMAQIRAPESGDIIWHGVDEDGHPVTSGVYIVRARSGSQTATCRISLVRAP
jgi:hypothetical protein